MSRSLRVIDQHIKTAKAALKRSGWLTQRALAEDLHMALSTVSRFLNGKPVDYAVFLEICDRINLDWQFVADLSSTNTPEPHSTPEPNCESAATEVDSTAPKTELPSQFHTHSAAVDSVAVPVGPLQDWGEVTDTDFFHGRQSELRTLERTILVDSCRLVLLLGIGGIGKTSLAAKLSQQIAPAFNLVIWRSVRNAPPLNTLLQDLVLFLSQQQDTEATLSRLMHWLRTFRCLIILDNVETLLSAGGRGQYRPGYEDYGELFRQIGETRHQSCLVVTGREKPRDIGMLESDHLCTRSFQLNGSIEAAKAIIQAKGIAGSDESVERLCSRYDANPLALKIVGTSIQSIFDGSIDIFLAEKAPIFNDFRRLLDQQFERLSSLEKTILYWLAINREWTTLSELTADIWPAITRADIFEAIESLSWRSLIETRSGRYTQQPVIMEYLTERLVGTIYDELEAFSQQYLDDDISASIDFSLWCTHALLKSANKAYIRESQRRMILSPIAQRIQTTFIQPQIISQYMQRILFRLRQSLGGYGIGNFINLCRQLQVDLSHYDFSELPIWQAHLSEVSLIGVNFAQASFRNCQFTYSFSGICALSLNPDNTLLAVGDLHSNIHFFQTGSYQHLCTLKGHTDGVFAISFTPDGQHFVSCSGDTTLRLWQVDNYECIKVFEGHQNLVKSVVFSPNGRVIASGSSDHTVKLWDRQTGECLRTLEGHTSAIRTVAFSHSGKELASASLDHTIRLWDWQSGDCIRILTDHKQGVWAVVFTPDDQWLVSGGIDQTVRVWDMQTGQCLSVLSGHQSSVWSVIVSPDGQYAASSAQTGIIKIWHLPSGRCEKSFLGHTGWTWALVFSDDSKRLYSGSHQDSTVRIWETQQGRCVKLLSGYTNAVWALTFSKDGQYIISGSHDKRVRLWDISKGKCLQSLEHSSPVMSLSLNRDESLLVSAGGTVGVDFSLWSLDLAPELVQNSAQKLAQNSDQNVDQNPVRPAMQFVRSLLGHTRKVNAVDFHPSGDWLASAAEDRTVRLWNIADGSCRRTINAHDEMVWSAVFSHDGRLLATGSYDHTAKLWEVETGECIAVLAGHSEQVLSVTFSPDDALIASTSSDGSVKIWAVESRRCLQTLTGHSGFISSGTFYPLCDRQEPIFVSGGFDHQIKVWAVESGQCLQTLEGHTQTIWSLAFSTDGRRLVSGDENATIKLWDTQSWQCLQTIKLPGPYEGMNIAGASGLSEAQKASLYALGATST
ncbi:MAG: NB-ARC domain-containing protein [Cyanobacteria bacterium P01_D01_bin.1]